MAARRKRLVSGPGVLKFLGIWFGANNPCCRQKGFDFFIRLNGERNLGLVAATGFNDLAKFAGRFSAECLFNGFHNTRAFGVFHDHCGPRHGLDHKQVPAGNRKHRRKQQGISKGAKHDSKKNADD